jgi:hypothetical protein
MYDRGSTRENFDYVVDSACRAGRLQIESPGTTQCIASSAHLQLTFSSSAFSIQQREVSSWTQSQESKAPCQVRQGSWGASLGTTPARRSGHEPVSRRRRNLNRDRDSKAHHYHTVSVSLPGPLRSSHTPFQRPQSNPHPIKAIRNCWLVTPSTHLHLEILMSHHPTSPPPRPSNNQAKMAPSQQDGTFNQKNTNHHH